MIWCFEQYRIKSFSDEQSRYEASLEFPPIPDVDALGAAGTAKVLAFDSACGARVAYFLREKKKKRTKKKSKFSALLTFDLPSIYCLTSGAG